MYFKRIRFVLIVFTAFLLLLGPGSAVASEQKSPVYDPGKTFTVDQLKDDFNLLRGALEEAHGGFYYYSSKEEMDRIFDDAYKALTQPATELQFFNSLMPLTAAINDGHTRTMLSKDAMTYLGTRQVLFPFNIRFFKNKAYLFRNYSANKDISMGGELLSINGHTVPEILKKLLPRVQSDAHIQTSKFVQLGSTAYFGTVYMAVFGQTTDFSIHYNTPGKNKTETFKVKGIEPESLMKIYRQRYPEAAKKNDPFIPISLEYKKGIPVLYIRTFARRPYVSAKIDYKKFMAEAFKEFETKKIKHLIIDVRNNGGGSDEYGKILAAYLLDKPFHYYESLETRVNSLSFAKYTGLSPGDAEEMKKQLKANDHGTYDVINHPNLGIQQPLKPTFEGKVFILINGGSFSATGEATSIIHFHKKAIFIGEECGSGYYGNTSGMGEILTLPHSKIRVSIPLVRYAMAVSDYPKNHGIIPEHIVPTTINDLLNDKDPQLEYTLKLIQK
jgi:C-terminal processing protease CtpA/Prc